MNYSELLSAWGVEYVGVDESALVEGSPERTASRRVVRDSAGGRWVLEEIEQNNLLRKQAIAGQLEVLSGLEQILPYCRTNDGLFVSDRWMLRPYIKGVPLERPGWLNDLWRIDALADFLPLLRSQTADWSGPAFSIVDYATERMAAWRKRCSELAAKLEHSFWVLQQRFFPLHDKLPVAFCHGDYHPLNMVWGEESICAVIDWEFCGFKPELYDVALLVGCIGFEEPDNLIREPVIRLVRRLRAAGFGVAESWDSFLELTATIRFGWMSEWIRRDEYDTQQMEALYIEILISQREYILQHWFCD